MKKTINYLLCILIIAALNSCSGSDTYRGTWKATTKDGQKSIITFAAKEFTISDSTQKDVHFNYTQNAVKIENSQKTYGIKLNDGRNYHIFFPSSDKNTALILDENNEVLYTIGRDKYINYNEIYQLK